MRPDFTRPANSVALASSDVASTSSAGSRSSATASAAATWMAVGKVSLLDWLALTWSLGCTSTPARPASEAITSLAFMFELVPGAGLEDVDRERVVVLARGHRAGGGLDRRRLLGVDDAERAVHLRRRPP